MIIAAASITAWGGLAQPPHRNSEHRGKGCVAYVNEGQTSKLLFPLLLPPGVAQRSHDMGTPNTVLPVRFAVRHDDDVTWHTINSHTTV